MEFNEALILKKEISEDFIQPKIGKTARIVVYSAPVSRSAGRHMDRDIRNDIHAIGVFMVSKSECGLKIYTRKYQASPEKIARHFGVNPKNIFIKKTGPIINLSSMGRHRPPFPGISIGHYNVTAGTWGCVVKDSGGKEYILSNNHVLANTNRAVPGDLILQPGSADQGTKPSDAIAKLADFQKLSLKRSNFMDAAIASLDLAAYSTEIPEIGRVNGTGKAEFNKKVCKYGRTTGHTLGKIVAVAMDSTVQYETGKYLLKDQFEIEGSDSAGHFADFSRPGDSGSLIVEQGTGQAVGLLFAGIEGDNSFATPIDVVLKRFNVTIV